MSGLFRDRPQFELLERELLPELIDRRRGRGLRVWSAGAALVENLGYRQINSIWRLRAFVDLARGRRAWGEMPRRGLAPLPVDARHAT